MLRVSLRLVAAALCFASLAGPAPGRVVPAAAAAPSSVTPRLPDAYEAPVALLVDLSSGQTLFSREPNRRFMPASMTKVMTVFTAFELIDHGALRLDRQVAVSSAAFKAWNRKGSTMFLGRDDHPTIDQLLRGITTVSANDGAVVLGEGIAGSLPAWIALMNREAQAIGMKDSHFGTPNGWMDEGNTYVTAADLARLAEAMITRHPKLYAHYFGQQEFSYGGITQHNHDPITGIVPGADGIKTGFTNQAGYGFLGSAKRGDRRLVMVVATVDNPRARNTAARNLMEWGFAAFDTRLLYRPGAHVADAAVQGGSARDVPLVSDAPVTVSFPKGGVLGPVRLTVRYDGPLRAPIRKGTQVAQLEVEVGGQQAHGIPLLAAADVPAASTIERLRNGIVALFE